MARLANISGKEAVKAFRKAGWEQIGQVGSHVVMVKANPDRDAYLTYIEWPDPVIVQIEPIFAARGGPALRYPPLFPVRAMSYRPCAIRS